MGNWEAIIVDHFPSKSSIIPISEYLNLYSRIERERMHKSCFSSLAIHSRGGPSAFNVLNRVKRLEVLKYIILWPKQQISLNCHLLLCSKRFPPIFFARRAPSMLSLLIYFGIPLLGKLLEILKN